MPPRSFIEEITPPAARDELDQARVRDRVLGALVEIMGPQRSLEWLHSFGVCSVPELAALFPPVPPEHLRRITAAPQAELFLWSGLVDAGTFAELFERHWQPEPAARSPRALDLACGCGRIARFLSLWRCELFGSELNPELAAWCTDNLDGFTVSSGRKLPPLEHPDAFFDLAYAYSLFTHTPEQATRAWLQELARIVAPGGIVMFTTNGMRVLAMLARSEVNRGRWGVSEEQVRTFTSEVKAGEFAAMPYVAAPGDADPGIGEGYGLSFTGLNRVATVWAGKDFEVVEQLPGGSRGIQDVTVLRRRPRSPGDPQDLHVADRGDRTEAPAGL